jgi:UDP-N-acetylglucosamine--N-acetylmuramyl-(pentapeptide) pyrophosphoryl-undecaprenol N-acetylglucosamine transferase
MAMSWGNFRALRISAECRTVECSRLYGSVPVRGEGDRVMLHLRNFLSPKIGAVCAAIGKEKGGEVVSAGPRVLFAAGGTGGHVYPALAIADEVRVLNPAAEIEFVGTKERMEWDVVPKAGYAISPIPAVAIRRPFWSLSNVFLPVRLVLCLWISWRVVRRFRPDVVVGTGGYVAGPLCLVAALSGAAVAIQEQNAYAGLSNRILGRVAKVVFVAFAAATVYFPKKKCVLIGNPTRRVLRQPIDRVSALRSFFDVAELDVDGHEEVIVVMGGSLGARLINEAVAGTAISLLEQNPRRYIIWQTGTINYDITLSRVGTHPRLALLP